MDGQSLLKRERALFVAQQEIERRAATQRAALKLLCGLDLDTVLAGGEKVRRDAVAKVKRLLRREQLKGWRRHYAYDINRHIALKQALLLLAPVEPQIVSSP